MGEASGNTPNPQHEYNRSQSHIFVRSRNCQRERLIWLNLSEFLWTQWAILRLLEISSIPSRTLLSPVVDAGSDSTNRAVSRVRGPVKGDNRCRRTPPPRKVDKKVFVYSPGHPRVADSKPAMDTTRTPAVVCGSQPRVVLEGRRPPGDLKRRWAYPVRKGRTRAAPDCRHLAACCG